MSTVVWLTPLSVEYYLLSSYILYTVFCKHEFLLSFSLEEPTPCLFSLIQLNMHGYVVVPQWLHLALSSYWTIHVGHTQRFCLNYGPGQGIEDV